MRKIIVVEDDRFISAVYSLFLKNLGYEIVASCKSGIEALEECEVRKPDIVLMDIHIEGELDGIQTAERIRRECELPVIFVSGDTSSEVVERAVISNSYGYLVKPVNEKELGITIELAYYKHKADLDQKRREKSFRAFVSEAPMPIIIVQNGVIRYLNHLSLDLFKTHYIEDVVMLPITDFVDERDHAAIKKVLDGGEDDKTVPFGICLKTLHGKPVEVMVYCSRSHFNNAPAFQMAFIELKEQLICRDNLQKWRMAALLGAGPVLLLNNNFEVIDYNQGFHQLVQPAFDMRGHPLQALTAKIGIDEKMLANAFAGEKETPARFTMKISSRPFSCLGYAILDDKGEVENYLVALNEH